MLTNLAELARSAKLTVMEIDGWRTRGHGQMSDVRTITCHHTAGPKRLDKRMSLPVVKDGRPGLSGPLAHYYLDRDGTVYVVAAGLCYHAGVSLSNDFTNSHAIGIEAEAAGTGWSNDWPPVQMRAYETLCRALCSSFGLNYTNIRGHKETCAPKGRKSDPSFDMTVFRSHVRTPPIVKPEDKNDMADITPAQMDQIADKVVAKMMAFQSEVFRDGNKDGKRDVLTVRQMLATAPISQTVLDELRELRAEVDALKTPPTTP